MIIAIDGPAGSGKSTTAQAVARKLNFKYIDTGAMYRGITLKFLRGDINIKDDKAVEDALKNTEIELTYNEDALRVLLDGEDVTELIRSREINDMVSKVAEMPVVRQYLVPRQRKFAEDCSVVAEGRDMGSVVFPNADLKIYLTAADKERAKRRLKEIHDGGGQAVYEEVLNSIKNRDHIDSSRLHSPLTKTTDAIVIDTTELQFDAQVDKIISLYKEKVNRGITA